MTEEQRLREAISMIIRKELQPVIEDCDPEKEEEEEIEEISTSAGAGAYLMPMAFTGAKPGGIKKQRSNAEQLGYKITSVGEKDLHRADKLAEAVSRYHEYKKDPRTPRHKIGKAIVEIGRHLDEIGKMVAMNVRLKKESNIPTSDYWKRTMGQMARLEQKMIRIAEKLREMKI